MEQGGTSQGWEDSGDTSNHCSSHRRILLPRWSAPLQGGPAGSGWGWTLTPNHELWLQQLGLSPGARGLQGLLL